MSRKIFFSTTLVFLLLAINSSEEVFGLFNDEASAVQNTFSTAASFPSPSPSVLPSPVVSPSPAISPSPNVTPPPNQQPEFPVCPVEPGANVNEKKWDVGYDEGWHWIIFQGMKFGSDYVYFLNGKDKVLQCYYPLPRTQSGVQTNWLKKGENFEGWQEWPQGTDFGLNPGPYVVKNTDFPAAPPSGENLPSPSPSPEVIELETPESTQSAEEE